MAHVVNPPAPIVALIPARGGSQRFPNKNMHPFHGKPLAEWTLDLAERSGLFDTIIVSTDVPELTQLAQHRNLAVQHRPSNLAGNQAPLLDVIRYTIADLGLASNAGIVLLPVTNPLRVLSDLIEGLRLFEAHGRTRGVISVSENPYPPSMMWTIQDKAQKETQEGTLMPFLSSGSPTTTRKQDHEATYMWNDIFVIDSAERFLLPGRNLFGEMSIPLVCPQERGISVDYAYQLKVAASLFPPIDERILQE